MKIIVKQLVKRMQNLKSSFKNLISTDRSASRSPEASGSGGQNNRLEKGSDNGPPNTHFVKSFNQFIKFGRSFSFKQQAASNNENNSNAVSKSTKHFLRSSIKSTSTNSQQTDNKSLEDLLENIDESNKRKLFINNQHNELKSEILFQLLDNELNELIAHFRPLVVANSVESHFLDSQEESAHVYFNLAAHASDLLRECLILYRQLECNCHLYDFDETIKSNGYRSMLKIFEMCVKRMLKIVQSLNEKKTGFLFQIKMSNSNLQSFMTANANLKEFQTYVKLMERIQSFLAIGFEMQQQTLSNVENENNEIPKFHPGPSLYLHSNELVGSNMEINLIKLGSMNLDVYFGRACGFQFCDSLVKPLTGVAVALACYNDGYEAFSASNSANSSREQADSNESTTTNSSDYAKAFTTQLSTTSGQSSFNQAVNSLSLSNTLGQAAKSLFSSPKYLIDPELRGRKISYVMKHANVDFCKAFWQLTETSIVQMGSNLITPTIALNITKNINIGSPLRVPKASNNDSEYVDVQPPCGSTANDFVRIRLLSHEIRQGMDDLIKSDQTLNDPTATATTTSSTISSNLIEPSKYLILHAHGGGFIAHSSKSHEIYLKPWCKELKIPIVSIDYSLSPEHQFPRASEECFYVYVWCLLNKEKIGWTGEKIVCVGDSAGGLLVTNIVQRAIINQIRIPDVLVPIYAPFLCTYSLSPSKLLSIMDPLLNYGILWRCLAAYCGIDIRSESEIYRQINSTLQSNGIDLAAITNKKRSSFSSSSSPLAESNHQKPPTTDSSNYSIRYSKSFSQQAQSTESADDDGTNLEKVVLNLSNAQTNDHSNREKLTEDDRLAHLHQLMGDTVFLIEKLRNHELPMNQFMSPLLSSDHVIKQFPKTYLIASNDPFLDDYIELAKRLRLLKQKPNSNEANDNSVELIVLDNGTPHGFLNMKTLTEETNDASDEIVKIIKECFVF